MGAVSEATKMRDSKRTVIEVIGSILVVSGAASCWGVRAVEGTVKAGGTGP